MKQLTALLLLLSFFTTAHTLSGKIYDSNLNQVTPALVQVTSPKQINVAVNGTYSFEIPAGNYELQVLALVNGRNLTFIDNITIENSSVTYDVILIENQLQDGELSELSQSINENYNLSATYQKLNENNNLNPTDYAPFLILTLAALIAIITFKLKQNKKNTIEPAKPIQKTPITDTPLILEKSDEYKEQILNLLDKQGGAASQKELRNELPWSEARVSIELSELEKQGKIKRVKTGRANLIKKV